MSKNKKENFNTIGSGDSVFVYCGIPQGMIFFVDGEKVQFDGVNTSRLVTSNGADLEHGKFGVTKVEKSIWEKVKTIYGNTDMFMNGIIFAAKNTSDGDSEAEEKQNLKVGTEQLEEKEFITKPVKK